MPATWCSSNKTVFASHCWEVLMITAIKPCPASYLKTHSKSYEERIYQTSRLRQIAVTAAADWQQNGYDSPIVQWLADFRVFDKSVVENQRYGRFRNASVRRNIVNVTRFLPVFDFAMPAQLYKIKAIIFIIISLLMRSVNGDRRRSSFHSLTAISLLCFFTILIV